MAILLIGMLAAAVVYVSVRLYFYKRQIHHLLAQLCLLEHEETNLRLTSCCRIGKTEELIRMLNRIREKDRERMAQLRQKNRSYRETILGISHDIRTPLTSAKGYTQMLLRGAAGREEKRMLYIGKIEKRMDDVADLLDQLFAYARVEAGEQIFQCSRINLNNLFADTIALFYGDFVQAACEPAIETGQTPLYIIADAGGVKRIIENLIKNALVHGNGAYRFSVDRQKGQAVITAANRTDSIEKSDIESIFDRFYTTELSRTPKSTGLGLAIVKQFAEAMGGSAQADLTDGIFTVKVIFAACEKGRIARGCD